MLRSKPVVQLIHKHPLPLSDAFRRYTILHLLKLISIPEFTIERTGSIKITRRGVYLVPGLIHAKSIVVGWIQERVVGWWQDGKNRANIHGRKRSSFRWNVSPPLINRSSIIKRPGYGLAGIRPPRVNLSPANICSRMMFLKI